MSGTRHVLSGTDARSQAWMEIWSHCGNDEKGGSYEVAFGVMTRILVPPYQLDVITYIERRCMYANSSLSLVI